MKNRHMPVVGEAVKMASSDSTQSNKTWELSLYELQRTPQEAITDNTEIAVSPRSLHSELMCPICLDMLKNTMTTKECLHRFCQECIITALRSGNKECPTCRKKLVSKRSLRPDPNFDMLISKIYPSRDEYEAHQERVLAKLNRTHNQSVIATIEEGIKLQALNRAQRVRKHPADENAQNPAVPAVNSNSVPPSNNNNVGGNNGNNGASGSVPTSTTTVLVVATTNSAVPSEAPPEVVANNTNSNNSDDVPLHCNNVSVNDVNSDSRVPTPLPHPPTPTTPSSSTENCVPRKRQKTTTSADESGSGAEAGQDSVGEGEMGSDTSISNEIELVFKPHPQDEIIGIGLHRYIKTTANATVDHLSKYLMMRLALDNKMDEYGAEPLSTDSAPFVIYIASTPGTFSVLNGNMTLDQVNEKFWKVNKPLEMYYSVKK